MPQRSGYSMSCFSSRLRKLIKAVTQYKPTKCIFPILIFEFFMSSKRFEPDYSSAGRRLYTSIQVWYGTFYRHQYKQSGRQKSDCST
jgi:hypothetical protein